MRISILCLFVPLAGGPVGQPPVAPPPVSVFADLDGTWAGTFVSYDAAGNELGRITARHTYRTVSETEQAVQIVDVMPDGTEIRGTGTNEARRRPDGSLELRCLVDKSNGERVDHAGRLVRGPDGDRQIVWYTRRPGRVETFREVVRDDKGGRVYEINGMGRYGDTLVLMTGRYRRVE